MPRYVIERTYAVEESEVPKVATRSKRLARDNYPQIVWEHSHVVVDGNGTPKSFCIYDAPDEETVREHAERLGDHSVDAIYEIAGDVTPDDFPLDENSFQNKGRHRVALGARFARRRRAVVAALRARAGDAASVPHRAAPRRRPAAPPQDGRAPPHASV